jgi:hypothetical protein
VEVSIQSQKETVNSVMNVLCMYFDIYNNLLGYMSLLVVYLAKTCLTNRVVKKTKERKKERMIETKKERKTNKERKKARTKETIRLRNKKQNQERNNGM